MLLSYRASPNYRDAKGLTPIFHTAIMGDDAAACHTLLRHRAELGCTDHGGWTELHHVRREKERAGSWNGMEENEREGERG